jgi:AcrR family transcriptional regulator
MSPLSRYAGRVTETQLRRDAAANRERVLEAAQTLFDERGLGASMDEIARAAGVGPATLYRRFPTKEALLDAILLDALERFEAFAREALAEDDAFTGLALLLERGIELQASSRGFQEILLLRLGDEPQLAEARKRVRPLIAQLVERAQAQGTLRADFEPLDVQVLLWELGRVVESTGRCASSLWRRYLALALDGLRTEAARPLPVAAPTQKQLDQAMAETAESRGLRRGKR